MKKILFLSLLISLVSFSAFAQMGSAYNSVKEAISDMTGPTDGEVCLPDSSGTIRKGNRHTWEISLRGNLLDTPNGGEATFETRNLDIVVYHNTSNFLYFYGAYGNRFVEKNHYEGQEYEDSWEIQNVYGGIGIYITPSFTVSAGLGQIWAKDNDGKEVDIRTALERTIAYDLPFSGNKLRISFRSVDAPQDGDDLSIEESTADMGFSTLAIEFVVSL